MGEQMPQYFGGFEQEFYRQTQLSLDDYYTAISIILVYWTQITPEMVAESNERCGGFNLDTLCDNMNETGKMIFNRYLDVDSQDSKQLTSSMRQIVGIHDPEDDVDLSGILLDKPILKTVGIPRMAIVLDPVVLNERANLGPFWTVMKTAPNRNNLPRLLGEAFEKEYANNCFRELVAANANFGEYRHDLKAINSSNLDEVRPCKPGDGN